MLVNRKPGRQFRLVSHVPYLENGDRMIVLPDIYEVKSRSDKGKTQMGTSSLGKKRITPFSALLASWIYFLLSGPASLAAPQMLSGGASAIPPLPSQYAPNLAQNPGFESGLTNWTASPCVTTDTTSSHSGAYSAKLANCGSGTVNALTQSVGLSGHESLLVRFWVKTDANFNGAFNISVHDENHGGGTALWTRGRDLEAVGPGSAWVQIGLEKYINVFEHGNDSQILIQLQVTGLTSGTAWVDDVEILQQWYPVRSFLKYPNYRGYLWNDKTPGANLCGANPFQMEICGVSEIDPPSGKALASTTLTVSLSSVAHCAQNVLGSFTQVPNSSSVAWTLNGRGLTIGKPYYVCTSLNTGGQNFTYPDWVIVPQSAAFRATLNNWFDVDGAWVHAGARQLPYGTYDRWSSTYRIGRGAGMYASGSACSPAQTSAENCYIYDVQGMGTAKPAATDIPGLLMSGGPSAFADYKAQNFNVIMSINPGSGINPTPGDDQLTPYNDALRDFGASNAQITNNYYGYLGTETDTPEAPSFAPVFTEGSGSINAKYLFVQITGVAAPGPTGTQETETETIPTPEFAVNLQASSCKGANCSVSFTLPPCPTSRWAGYYLYTATSSTSVAPPASSFQRQYNFPLASQLAGTAPTPCGVGVILSSLITTGITPPLTDGTRNPARPIWGNRATDASMLSTLAATMSNPAHTGGAAFYVADEPNAEAINTAYRISSQLSAGTSGVPTWATLAHPSATRLWRDVVDILAVDPYGYGQSGPSPDEFWAGDTGNFTCTGYVGTYNLMGESSCLPDRVDTMTDELSRASYGSRPEWIVVQQYDLGQYKAIPYTEMRRQVLKALIGCQNWGNMGCGVLTWGWVSEQGMTSAYYVEHDTQAWSDSQAVGSQIASLGPAIMSPVMDSPLLGFGSVVSSVGTDVAASTACGANSAYANSTLFPHGAVRFVSKQMPNGDQYIFATNLCGNQNPFDVTFQLAHPPAGQTSVQVFGENRTLSLAAGQFTDLWNGYDVHVYYIPAVPAK